MPPRRQHSAAATQTTPPPSVPTKENVEGVKEAVVPLNSLSPTVPVAQSGGDVPSSPPSDPLKKRKIVDSDSEEEEEEDDDRPECWYGANCYRKVTTKFFSKMILRFSLQLFSQKNPQHFKGIIWLLPIEQSIWGGGG